MRVVAVRTLPPIGGLSCFVVLAASAVFALNLVKMCERRSDLVQTHNSSRKSRRSRPSRIAFCTVSTRPWWARWPWLTWRSLTQRNRTTIQQLNKILTEVRPWLSTFIYAMPLVQNKKSPEMLGLRPPMGSQILSWQTLMRIH